MASIATLTAGLPQNGNIISHFKQLSPQQLSDTGNYYYKKRSIDTALICYSLLINTPVKDADFEQQKRIVEAYNRSAIVYEYLCDYRTAYEFLIKALLLCEKANYKSYEPAIYTNIGNVYYRFDKYDMAKLYYSKALQLCSDSTIIVAILNNLGATEIENGRKDSAFYYLNKSLQISKRHDDAYLCNIQSDIALLYQKSKRYDSAYYYLRLSLDEARKNNRIEKEAENLSELGKLFFEINKTDSALFYIDLSNTMAIENNFLRILAENHLTSSKIEESKGNTKSALAYFKKYAKLGDSIFNAKNFGDINQLQRLYEVSKVNQQIEQLVVEQQIKERTIYYQTVIQIFTLVVLLLVSIILLSNFLQKRKLNKAYKTLFEKNIEIINLQGSSSEKYQKYKQSALTYAMQNELLNKILIIMEDTSIICDSRFSIDKLAELAQSNQTYVSQVINNALNKNFRSFLNSYRIQEAQRLFSEPDAAKYTIESVALRVGFNSRNTFHNAFAEITGVSPSFYLKSMQSL
jgi:AraC-like DNA-binding protein